MKTADREVILEPIDRRNYRKLFTMQLRPEQISFVTPPRWTLARCYVRLFGDKFEHLPHLIVAAGEVVGYATTVCDPASADDYWIDDIMIDAEHQGKGYGRAARGRDDQDDRRAISAMPSGAADLLSRQYRRRGTIHEPWLRADGQSR